MKNLVKFIIFITIAGSIIGASVSSCSEETNCALDGRPTLNCYMYKIVSNVVKSDTLDSLTVTAFGTDSIIINNQTDVHYILLPLRYTTDSTIFVLHYSETLLDTIIVRYTNTAKFISMDCGYQMQQSVTGVSYTEHNLDSIYISNEDANTLETENFKLFH
jgi:hypothetical protein